VRPIAWRGQCYCPDSCSRSVNVVSHARRAPQHTCRHYLQTQCAHNIRPQVSLPRLVSPDAQQWESCTHNASPAQEVVGLTARLQHPAQGPAIHWYSQGSCQGGLQHHPRGTVKSKDASHPHPPPNHTQQGYACKLERQHQPCIFASLAFDMYRLATKTTSS
jgi:hypothetical protein